jgi:hypothetical protein
VKPILNALAVIALLSVLCASPLAGQEQTAAGSTLGETESPHPVGSLPATDTPALSADELRRQKAAEEIKKQEKQRILGIIPQFNVSNITDAVRLSPKQKLELAFKTSVDPFTFLFAGIDSAISQGEDSFPGYGLGAEGYAKRFGASYMDSFDGTMIGNAFLPIVLHQDPRYFRKGTGRFASRLSYAVLSTVRCKSDSGHWQPNYSNLFGNFAAGAISDLYYPSGDRGLVSTYQRAIVVSSEGAIGATLAEFWPDIAHHFFKKHYQNQNAH